MYELCSYMHLPFVYPTSELLQGESEGLLKLPSDLALLDDPEFRRYVELYAKVYYRDLNIRFRDLLFVVHTLLKIYLYFIKDLTIT